MTDIRDLSPDDTSLVLQVDLPARQADVMAAWTDPQRLTRWWPPRAELDPQPGGAYALTWPDQGWTLRGRILELTAQAIAFTWRWDHRPELPDRTVRVTVAAGRVPASSVLSLHHGPYDGSQRDLVNRAEHVAGWRYFLDRLAGTLSVNAEAE